MELLKRINLLREALEEEIREVDHRLDQEVLEEADHLAEAEALGETQDEADHLLKPIPPLC